VVAWSQSEKFEVSGGRSVNCAKLRGRARSPRRGSQLSNFLRWMIDHAASNNDAEPDAARGQNFCRDQGCDLYFSEVLQGYFKLRPRRPIERLRIEDAGKVYCWVERSLFAAFAYGTRRRFHSMAFSEAPRRG
jgi:hypothetical protein